MFLWDKSFRLKGFGYYILGSFLIIFFNSLAQIPMLYFASWDSITPESNPMDIFNHLSKNFRFFLILLTPALTAPAIWFIVNKLHDLPIMSIITSRKKIDFGRVLYGFSTSAIVVLTIVMITYFISPENYEFNFRVKEFLIAILVLETFMIGVFCSLDLVIFYLFFAVFYSLLVLIFLFIHFGMGSLLYFGYCYNESR